MTYDDFCNTKVIMDLHSILRKSKGKCKRTFDAGGMMVEMTKTDRERP